MDEVFHAEKAWSMERRAMSFWKRLGLGQDQAEGKRQRSGRVDAVRSIVSQLEALPDDQASYVAAFAYVLSRVANADLAISPEETGKMEIIVRELAGLPEDLAVLVVQIAKSQNQLFGGTQDFLVTRELAETATLDQKEHLLHCLFAVAAADDSISSQEESHVRQIASELGFTHRQFVDAMSHYSEKRAVLKGL
jgi:uncharacterized tellurite resistance protein B-like protein